MQYACRTKYLWLIMLLGCKMKQGIRTYLVVWVRMLTVSLQLALDVWLADNTMNKG